MKKRRFFCCFLALLLMAALCAPVIYAEEAVSEETEAFIVEDHDSIEYSVRISEILGKLEAERKENETQDE